MVTRRRLERQIRAQGSDGKTYSLFIFQEYEQSGSGRPQWRATNSYEFLLDDGRRVTQLEAGRYELPGRGLIVTTAEAER